MKVRSSFLFVVLLVILGMQLPSTQKAVATSTAVQGGFIFPWSSSGPSGTITTNEHEGGAIDIIKIGNSNFDILAPKDGIVLYMDDSSPDSWHGNCSQIDAATNYIVLGHGPVQPDGNYPFYTLYYHLRSGSINSEFNVGYHVHVGQFMAIAGNTGHVGGVTGIHLHFAGTDKPVRVLQSDVYDCSGNKLASNRTWVWVPTGNVRPVGFEEVGNQWPLLGGAYFISGVDNASLPVSYNSINFQTNVCLPGFHHVILYEHRNYGGECFGIIDPSQTTNVPDNLGPGGLNVSSVYLDPLYFSTHILHLFDNYNASGKEAVIFGSSPTLGVWNDKIKSVHNSTLRPAWLQTQSFTESLPFNTNIHVVVTDSGDFDAMRVCFNEQNCQETGATELFYNWNTYGWSDGSYVISIQYRVDSDGGNWANAEKADFVYSLSPIREAYAPCGSSVEGVQLTSGSDCIVVVHEVGDLAPVGWADRANLQACVTGNSLIAWLFDDVRDQYGNFPGSPHTVSSSECKPVGGNVSSVRFLTTQEIPTTPATPFTVDASTAHLYHFDEGNGTTLVDSVGSLNGTINSSNWVTGRFGNALYFPNPTDGRAAAFGTMDICPMSFETWVQTSSAGGRIAGQLGSNGNSGANKWLLSLDGLKPKFEVWSNGGSLNATSYRDIPDAGWHYIMATYDCSSKVAALYLDNEIVGQFVSASSWNSGATTFEIGAVEGIYKCNCTIDEVRVSNTVRVPGEEIIPINPTPTLVPSPSATITETPTPTLTQTPGTQAVIEGVNLTWTGGATAHLAFVYENGDPNATHSVGWTCDNHIDTFQGVTNAIQIDHTCPTTGNLGVVITVFGIGTDPTLAGASVDIPTPTSTVQVVVTDVTNTPSLVATDTPTATSIPSGTELLGRALTVQASLESAEDSLDTFDPNALIGKTNLQITYDLHGLCALGGDASAFIFNQGGDWRYISLSNYGQNCFDGIQVITVPLSDFPNLNTSAPIEGIRTRFWASNPYRVDIYSVIAFGFMPTATSTPNFGTSTMVPTATLTETAIPTSTLTPTLLPTEVPTSTPTQVVSQEVELLSTFWHLAGSNGSEEAYQDLNPSVLQGFDTLRITYDLHGLTALSGDASAIIIDQNNDWHFVSLSDYGQNGYNGTQQVEIPLSNFPGLNLNEGVGSLHVRFWYDGSFTVDILSIVAFDSPAR